MAHSFMEFRNTLPSPGAPTKAVVIADGVGGAEIGDPSRFEERDQPRLVLARHSHGAGHRERDGAAHPDGLIENRVDAPQEGSAEGWETVPEQIVERLALVD